MRVFAIKSDSYPKDKDLGYLFYYEKSKTFYIELPDKADPWETPLLLSSLLEKGIYTINPYYSMMWVRQRIVPTDRQNLGYILKANHMTEYDEFKMLMLAHGRCEQDDCYLAEIEETELPECIKERAGHRIASAAPLGDGRILVEFVNDNTAVFRLAAYMEAVSDGFREQHDRLEKDVVSPGGFYYIVDQNIIIPSGWIYEHGERLPLTAKQLDAVATQLLLSTTELREELECSRQNIDDMVKRGRITPVPKNANSKWFHASAVNALKWE